MTVFKTFWKVVNKYKGTIIGYTVLLLIFGTLSMSSSDVTEDFKSSKPDVIIVDNDKSVLSNNLVKYFNDNANILDIDLEEEKIDDAIFYRDANYVIYIDEGYEYDVLNGNNPEINIKSSKDYSSSLAEMLLKRYLKTQDVLHDEFSDKSILVNKINDSLKTNANVELATKINTTGLTRLSRYYNFASYSIIAVVMFIICLVLSSFNEERVKKRTIISSMNYKKYNKCIMLSSILYVLFVVILYTILGFIVFGSIMFSKRGLIYILNTFIFAIVALALSLLVSTLVNKKERPCRTLKIQTRSFRKMFSFLNTYFIRRENQIRQPSNTSIAGQTQRRKILTQAYPAGVKYTSLSLAAGRLISMGYSSYTNHRNIPSIRA